MLRNYILLTVLFLSLGLSLSSHANGRVEGDKVGNGGGLWVCGSDRGIRQGILIDLYEAQEEFGLSLLSYRNMDPLQIVQERSDFVRRELPQYSVIWNRILAESLTKIRMVNSELVIVDDALYRIKPSRSSCVSGWEYMQFANFTNQDQILIRKDLWESFYIESSHKAALIWHEVIYKWLREHYQDKNSVRARQVVGLLFSTVSTTTMLEQIEKLLTVTPDPAPVPDVKIWMCMVENRHTSMFYAAQGASQLAAQTKALGECQKDSESFFCSNNTKCEQITSTHIQYSCQIENRHIGKVYLGEGRSLVEAEFSARNQCQQGPQKFFCSKDVACE